ncbi:MAG: hypothetical protein D8B42_08890 [Kingella sp. (in: b-proteobacteria)]|nr:MAG: hypothetical protein D8B42_08890 [Kingella sp. (in: b-proteobacteria)]
MAFGNLCKNHTWLAFRQDSRLRGNDGRFTLSCFVLGWATFSGCLWFKVWLAFLGAPSLQPFAGVRGQSPACPRRSFW